VKCPHKDSTPKDDVSSMRSVTAIAAQGIYEAMGRASERASRIASSTLSDTPSVDDAVVVDIIGLSLDARQVEANQKVFQVGASMEQAVLDILA
jgi:hypothetical protein